MLKSKPLIFALILIVVIAGLYFFGSREFAVKNSLENKKKVPQEVSPISGKKCKNYNRRPFAVMISGDQRVRPLSGIAAADLVIEMPVYLGGVNRLMAVYVCGEPEEIGSVRSARHDFIPLAMGLDAIYAHWGGSHFALDKLNAGIMDNIDALPNRYNAYYRKSESKPPDNGFTSIKRLVRSAKKYGYRLKNHFEGYKHLKKADKRQQTAEEKILKLGYPGKYKVEWKYNPHTNSFTRYRNGTPEIDKLTGKAVKAKNIVIMRAKQHHLEGQYNDVDITGTGQAAFYRDGKEFAGRWKKPAWPQHSKLEFLTDSGKEFAFVPGPIWIEIIGPDKEVSWE